MHVAVSSTRKSKGLQYPRVTPLLMCQQHASTDVHVAQYHFDCQCCVELGVGGASGLVG
jgi:hypothetical protein